MRYHFTVYLLYATESLSFSATEMQIYKMFGAMSCIFHVLVVV